MGGGGGEGEEEEVKEHLPQPRTSPTLAVPSFYRVPFHTAVREEEEMAEVEE